MRSVDEIARELACCRKEECRQRIAAALREARVEAFEEAAHVAHARGESLATWMRTLPVNSAERKDKSLRAGELLAVGDEIKKLADSARREGK